MPVVDSLLGPGRPPDPPTVGVWCIVVAAGSGRRFGGAKQFELLDGERVVDRRVRFAAACCEGVVLVVPPELVSSPAVRVDGATSVVAGGATRAASVRSGLAVVPESARVILVHDAARPAASPELFHRVVDAVLGGADAVVPVVPVVDTIRRTDGTVVDRDDLRAVQTPQGFASAALRAAHADGDDASDDAALVQAAGGRLRLVDGEPRNLKLTGPDDLVVLRAFLRGDDGGSTDAFGDARRSGGARVDGGGDSAT